MTDYDINAEAVRIMHELGEISMELDHAREYARHPIGADRRRDLDVARTAATRIAEVAARIAGGEYRPDYNGWKNRETWNTALWLDNEQGSSEYAREIVAQHVTDPERGPYDDDAALDRRIRIRNAADALREWYDEAFTPTRPGNVVDAWMYAVAVTDWYAIADGIAEDMTTPAEDAAKVAG